MSYLATNTFDEGLLMDLSTLNTPSNVMTNALNATLLTRNGNEYVLLNDMGNGRVETAFLPEGFIPLGTTLLGGIVYIVSYNPLTNQSLIGSFPSPERNILSTELDIPKVVLNDSAFYETENAFYETENGDVIDIIKNPRYKLTFLNCILNQGDKFLIFSDNLDRITEYLSAYGNEQYNINKNPRYLKLHVVSVDDLGKITFLDKDLVWYNEKQDGILSDLIVLDKNGNPVQDIDENGKLKWENEEKTIPIYKYRDQPNYISNVPYYIKEAEIPSAEDGDRIDIDEYRKVVTANYSVYTAQTKGNLAILAELEAIDSFDVTYNAVVEDYNDPNKEFNKKATLSFNLNWTYENEDPITKNKINLFGYKVEGKSESKNNNLNSNRELLDVEIQYPVRTKIKNSEYYSKSKRLTDIKDYEQYTENDFWFLCESEELDNIILNKITKRKTKLNINEELNTDKELNSNKELYSDFEQSIRKNDGTDSDFKDSHTVEIYFYKELNPEVEEESNIITLTVTPSMPYGYLDYLKKYISIDLSKIGSGDTDLVEYRYYVNTTDNDKSVILNWGLDCYPEEGQKVEYVLFDFYELDNENNFINENCVIHKDNKGNRIYTELLNSDKGGTFITELQEYIEYDSDGELNYHINNKQEYIQNLHKLSIKHTKESFSGHFSDKIQFGNDIYNSINDDSINDNNYIKGSLQENNCYFVKITIKYGNNLRYYYRFLYTIPVFNELYFKEIDFSKINLSDVYKLKFNIENNSIITNGRVEYKNLQTVNDIKSVNSIKQLPLDGVSDIVYCSGYVVGFSVTINNDVTFFENINYFNYILLSDSNTENNINNCIFIRVYPQHKSLIQNNIIFSSLNDQFKLIVKITRENLINSISYLGTNFTLNDFIYDNEIDFILSPFKNTSSIYYDTNQLNILNWNINANAKLINSNSNYNIFNNFILDDIDLSISSSINYFTNNVNTEIYGSYENIENIKLLEDYKIKLLLYSNNSDNITISGMHDDIKLLTPFTVNYSKESPITINYKQVPLTINNSKKIDLKLSRSYIILKINGEEIVKVPEDATYGIDVQSNTSFINSINNILKDYDVIELKWNIVETNNVGDRSAYTIMGQNDLAITNTWYPVDYDTDSSNISTGNRSVSISNNMTIFKTLIIRGKSNIHYIISGYRDFDNLENDNFIFRDFNDVNTFYKKLSLISNAGNSKNVTATVIHNEKTLNEFTDYYKWEKTNINSKVYNIENLVYYNNYYINLELQNNIFNNIKLKKYKINNYIINNNIPNNLKLDIDINDFSINNNFKIYTSELKNKLLSISTNDYYLLNNNEIILDGNPYFLCDRIGNKIGNININGIDYTFTINEDSKLQISDYNINVNNEKFNYYNSNKIKPSLCNIYICSETNKYPSKQTWMDYMEEKNDGQILLLYNFDIVSYYQDKSKLN